MVSMFSTETHLAPIIFLVPLETARGDIINIWIGFSVLGGVWVASRSV
jgi:hypothetical protein